MNKNTETGTYAAVVLAAGPSTRLGQAKQLVRHGGESLVRKTVRILQSGGPLSITVVTGCESESVENEISDLPVRIARNANWERGMGASIACGVRHVSEDADGILLMVCDQWKLEEKDISQLLTSWRTDISRIITACWHEGEAFVSGPPVMFPRNVKHELKYVYENRGARQVVDRHMEIVEFVTLENAAFDLDRPEDLDELT
jgi:CTP:molybdopterin cytidylyltransferase MocA